MEIKQLTKTYKTEYELIHALNHIDLVFPQKGLVFIVGVSGSGKSTLMNMLSGVDVPTSGEVIIDDISLYNGNKKQLFGYRNSYVGLIFQDYNLIEDLNVYENIKLPLEFLHQEDFSIVDEVIKKVDIEDIKYSQVDQISSGQMQRVAIARALVKNSAMILADEPTGNLDSKNTRIVMDLLKEISQDRLVVVITHDDDAAHEYGDRIIEIEDGKVLDDHLVDPSINEPMVKEKISFSKPIITFKQQLLFTFRFIRSNLARSIAIFIMLILIPIIGNVLCGYAFFDIATSFHRYQDEYGSNYIELADNIKGYSTYYSVDDYGDLLDKYGGENILEIYNTYVPLVNSSVDLEDSFYAPVIRNIVTDDYERLNYQEGHAPVSLTEVAITDYVSACYENYVGRPYVIGDRINIGGRYYDICGIVDTDYEKFLNKNLNDQMVQMAFQENLQLYNAVISNFVGYHNGIKLNMNYFVETINYTVTPRNIGDDPVVKEATVMVQKLSAAPTVSIVQGSRLTSSSGSGSSAMLSQNLWQNIMEENEIKVNSFSLSCMNSYGQRNRYLSIYASGIFRDLSNYGIDGTVIVKDQYFRTRVDKMAMCRILVQKDNIFYDKIIKTEKVVNPSFTYAKATWTKADSSKFVMYEFLITLLIIIVVFAVIINSMTLNAEKKKIGIKYSFGISKFPIIVPYLLETIFYVIVGFILSLVVVQFIFPWIMTTFVYTSSQEVMEYQFFYISWSSILGWDAIIYAVMFISLITMVLTICRKSPIEIIKDL